MTFAVFAAFRTYALWNKDLRVLYFVLLLGMLYPCGYAYYATRLVFRASSPPIPGCEYYSTLPSSITTRYGSDSLLYVCHMLGTGSIILFEGATALLTWLKTIPTIHRRQRNDTSSVKSISLVLFLDGTIQFVALLLMNAVSLVGFIPSIGFVFSDLIQTLTSIIISRFILDLRKNYASKKNDEASSFSLSDISTFRYGTRRISTSISRLPT
ncbi:hypothetical protein BC629DRAFT_1540450 [Irpex lacteus]|nr:hypothetical protein BC629DRAFT_1540450 [Irpex lacteus]